MRLLTILFATTALTAAPPLKVVVESAQITLGPGREPPPGSTPFLPRLEARFSMTNTPTKGDLRFRFWRARDAALATLHGLNPIRHASAGFTPQEGEVKALEPRKSFQFTAFAKGPWEGAESLVVEVLVNGRLAARGQVRIVEINLPSAPNRPVAAP
jgi:hypothetical protein